MGGIVKMAIDDWDCEEGLASCPSCGSHDVVVEASGGYFLVVICKKCGYNYGGGPG